MNLNVTKTTADHFSYGGRNIQYLLLSAMLCLRTLQVFLTGLALLYPFAEVSFFRGFQLVCSPSWPCKRCGPYNCGCCGALNRPLLIHLFIHSFC